MRRIMLLERFVSIIAKNKEDTKIKSCNEYKLNNYLDDMPATPTARVNE